MAREGVGSGLESSGNREAGNFKAGCIQLPAFIALKICIAPPFFVVAIITFLKPT